MRTAVISYMGFMMTMLLVVILSIITMKSSYYEIIRQSLDDSLEYTINRMQLDSKLEGPEQNAIPKTSITWSAGDTWNTIDSSFGGSSELAKREKNNEIMKKNFVEYLASNVNSKIDTLNIEIYGADAEYGLISARVTAEFTYPFGAKDSVSVRKTMILNREVKQ